MTPREDAIAALTAASALNREAQDAALGAAAEQRAALFAALDAGVSVPEASAVAGISRARIYALISDRNGL